MNPLSRLYRNKNRFDPRKITGKIGWDKLLEVASGLGVAPVKSQKEIAEQLGLYKKDRKQFLAPPDYPFPDSTELDYNATAHVGWLQHAFEALGLSENLEVISLSISKANAGHSPYIYTQNVEKIIIKNLKIFVEAEMPGAYYKNLAQFFVSPVIPMLEFDNCYFYTKSEGKKIGQITIFLGTYAQLKIQNCHFDGVTSTIESSTQYARDDEVLYLSRNLYTKCLISISTRPPQNDGFSPSNHHTDGYRFLNSHPLSIAENIEKSMNRENSFYKEFYSNEFDKKEKAGAITLADIMRFLRLYRKMTRIEPGNLKPDESIDKIRIKNNTFDALRITGSRTIQFENGNTANKLLGLGYKSNIYFSPHNNLIMDKSHAYEHRKLFIRLQKDVKEKEDYLQEQVFKREVLRCEQQIIEGQGYKDIWQDRFIFWWGEFSSRHGTSWMRPIILLLILNVIIAISMTMLDFSISEFSSEFPQILFNLLKPTYYIESDNWVVLLLATIQKIGFVGLAYEIIRAGRRFARI